MATLAKWESKTGRWTVSLEAYGNGAYGYQGEGSGGVLFAASDEDAVAQVQAQVDKGLFQPDSAKTAMRRVV